MAFTCARRPTEQPKGVVFKHTLGTLVIMGKAVACHIQDSRLPTAQSRCDVRSSLSDAGTSRRTAHNGQRVIDFPVIAGFICGGNYRKAEVSPLDAIRAPALPVLLACPQNHVWGLRVWQEFLPGPKCRAASAASLQVLSTNQKKKWGSWDR